MLGAGFWGCRKPGLGLLGPWGKGKGEAGMGRRKGKMRKWRAGGRGWPVPPRHHGTSAHAVRFELGVCTERACAYLKYLQDDGARKRMGRAWLDKMAEPKTMV